MDNEKQLFTNDRLEEISKAAVAKMEEIGSALKQRATEMDEKDLYVSLVDYAEKGIKQYFSNPENMERVLTNPHNIESIYNEMTETEEFKSLGSEEHRQLPRVVTMAMLAGAEANAADIAAQSIEPDSEEFGILNTLANIYQGYFKDALNYGHGNNKNIGFTGEKQ